MAGKSNKYKLILATGLVASVAVPAQAQGGLHEALFNQDGKLVGCAVVAKVGDEYKPVLGPYTGSDGRGVVGLMDGPLPEAAQFCAEGTPQTFSLPSASVRDKTVTLQTPRGEWKGRAVVTGPKWDGPQ